MVSQRSINSIRENFSSYSHPGQGMEIQGPGWMERFTSLSCFGLPKKALGQVTHLKQTSRLLLLNEFFCFKVGKAIPREHIPGAGCLSSKLPMRYPRPMHSHRSCKTVVSLIQFCPQSTVDLQTRAVTGQPVLTGHGQGSRGHWGSRLGLFRGISDPPAPCQ